MEKFNYSTVEWVSGIFFLVSLFLFLHQMLQEKKEKNETGDENKHFVALCSKVFLFIQIKYFVNSDLCYELWYVRYENHCTCIVTQCFSDNRKVSEVDVVGRLI